MKTTAGAIDLGGEIVPYAIQRRGARRKTIAIRLEGDGSILVRAPLRTADAEIETALALREVWITRARAALAQMPVALPLLERTTLPYLGAEVPAIDGFPSTPDFRLASRRKRRKAGAQQSEGAAATALVAWYRAAAAHLLPPQVAHRAEVIGQAPKSVVISRQKHAWGSCGGEGEIRLSYRLMMLRPELIDCVIVHELCHLVHHNHSPAFWAEVGRWQPDYKRLRAELKTAGLRLPV